MVLSAPVVPQMTPWGQVEISPVRYTWCPIVFAVTSLPLAAGTAK
jgi:hypothetical protein